MLEKFKEEVKEYNEVCRLHKHMQVKLEEARINYLNYIKTELEPHFKNIGSLYIQNDINLCLDIDDYNEDIENIVFSCFIDGTFDNCCHELFDYIGLDINSVWSDVGEELTYVEVLPFKEFDVNEWKKEFVNKYDKLYFDDKGDVLLRGCDLFSFTVIDSDNNVIFKNWYKLNSDEDINIKTQEDCDNFESIFANYMNSQTSKELNSEIDYVFEKLKSNSYADIYNYFKNTRTDEQVQTVVEKITYTPMNATSKDSCFDSLISYYIDMCINDILT